MAGAPSRTSSFIVVLSSSPRSLCVSSIFSFRPPLVAKSVTLITKTVPSFAAARVAVDALAAPGVRTGGIGAVVVAALAISRLPRPRPPPPRFYKASDGIRLEVGGDLARARARETPVRPFARQRRYVYCWRPRPLLLLLLLTVSPSLARRQDRTEDGAAEMLLCA